MVGDQGKEEQDADQILPRSASLLQGHAAFADSCDRWGSVELNGVTEGHETPENSIASRQSLTLSCQAVHRRAANVITIP